MDNSIRDKGGWVDRWNKTGTERGEEMDGRMNGLMYRTASFLILVMKGWRKRIDDRSS